jgi:hypothetical protein
MGEIRGYFMNRIFFSRDINIPNKDLIEKILKIDESVYPPELRGTLESVLGRYCANRDSFILLVDATGEIAGYLCCFPVTESFYSEMLVSDCLFDDTITPDKIVPYKYGAQHRLFVISIAVKPGNRSGAAKLIAAALEYFLLEKRKDGFPILSVAAYATTDKGRSFFTKSGFSLVKAVEGGYGFYVREF